MWSYTQGRGFILSLFCCLLSLLTGCVSSDGIMTDQLKSTVALTRHEILNIPFFPQLYDQCGPSSLATVLNYRQVETTPEELRNYVYLPEREGSLQIEMVAKARKKGQLVYPLAASLPDLLQEVSEDNPVLVLQNLRLSWWPQWHYSVVIGYDLNSNVIMLRSGSHKRYDVNIDLFNKTWQKAEQWGIVIVNPTHMPATAKEMTFIEAASNLEEIGSHVAAEQAYSTALSQWKDSRLALFGLANIAYAKEDYQQALLKYQKLLSLYPDFIGGWNNFSYTLNSLGCSSEAITAITCAIEKERDNSALEASLRELQKSPTLQITTNTICPDVNCRVSEH